MTVEGIALGRKLFYENMLSSNFTMSCASCHKQENAFSDPRRFSIGTDGSLGTRNSMTIFNHAWSSHFFWDGRRQSLEGQAHDPVTNPIEMENSWPVVVQRLQQDANYPNLFFAAFGTRIIDSTLVTKAIAQFERTLISFGSRYDRQTYQGQHIFTQQELNGEVIFFETANCAHCHAGVFLNDSSFHNNGLDGVPMDSGLAKFTHLASDYGKFKTPSLRNIALSAPYMHDGRFSSLQEVVHFYSAQVSQSSPNLDSSLVRQQHGPVLSQQQEDDLVAFLLTLTDSSFVTNPNFARP
jgi:cytochrome c peroxidase